VPLATAIGRAVATGMRNAAIVERPAAIHVIEVEAVEGVDELAAPRARDVATGNSRGPLLAKPAVGGSVAGVMLRVDRPGLAMTEAEPIPDRLRDEVGLAARLGALSAVIEIHRRHRLPLGESGREIPGRGSCAPSPPKRRPLLAISH